MYTQKKTCPYTIYIENMFVIVELFNGIQERREKKKE
jgi:hypothetical protein